MKNIIKKICEEHSEEYSGEHNEKHNKEYNKKDLRKARRRRFIFLMRNQHLKTITSMIKNISYDVEILIESDIDSKCFIYKLYKRSLTLKDIFILLTYIYLM